MNKKTIIGAGSFAAAGIVAGCLMSVSGIANASSAAPVVASSTSTTSAIAAPTFGDHGPDGKGGPKGGTAVTGDLKTTLSDLATAKVPEATIDDVIQHADGTYDVHLTKADDTRVSVEIDANQNITDVHEMTAPPAGGFGGHGPDGKGGPQGGTAVTGDLKATLSDLATAKVPDATIDDVIQHADGTYDVHLTKADDTRVSVEIDANQNITDVHEMTAPPAGGFGGHGPAAPTPTTSGN